MITPEIENLIIKYLTNQSSASELEALEEWLNDAHNEEVFKSYVKVNFAIDQIMQSFDIKRSKKHLLNVIEKEKKVFRSQFFYRITKYAAGAAVVVGVLATTYFFKDNLFNNPIEENPTVVNSVNIGSDKATLTLGDGTTVALEKGTTYSIKNVKSDGEKIVYAVDNQNNEEVVYNFLTIPRGGQFFVQLSDDTKVWLNSETKFKYPVNFVEGKPRNVELVYGEAYFEVSPSTQNQGSRFYVNLRGQSVEVLGTQFNVKAYQDETSTYTTLVEGKIVINANDQKDVLKPNQQAIVIQGVDGVSIKTVDVYNEISWKDGIFSFKGKSLKDLMKVLIRWYDVDVVFENKSLEAMNFKGVLDKNQTIEEILESIMSASEITSYEIKNKTIYIN
ncbi:MAG: FecR family protein [Gelidibacter sp.]